MSQPYPPFDEPLTPPPPRPGRGVVMLDEPIQVADRLLLRQLAAMDGMPQDAASLIPILAQVQMRLNYDLQNKLAAKAELEEI